MLLLKLKNSSHLFSLFYSFHFVQCCNMQSSLSFPTNSCNIFQGESSFGRLLTFPSLMSNTQNVLKVFLLFSSPFMSSSSYSSTLHTDARLSFHFKGRHDQKFSSFFRYFSSFLLCFAFPTRIYTKGHTTKRMNGQRERREKELLRAKVAPFYLQQQPTIFQYYSYLYM